MFPTRSARRRLVLLSFVLPILMLVFIGGCTREVPFVPTLAAVATNPPSPATGTPAVTAAATGAATQPAATQGAATQPAATATFAGLPTIAAPTASVVTQTVVATNASPTAKPTTKAATPASPTPPPPPPPTNAPAATPVPPKGPITLPPKPGPNYELIYLIAINDNGKSGPMVGCGDSAVPVWRPIPPTTGVLRAALAQLLSIHTQYFGQSGLYNALYQSNLAVRDVTIVGGVARIYLTGTLKSGGVCDDPRIIAQIQQTALQYRTVRSVQIWVNNTPIQQLLSGR